MTRKKIEKKSFNFQISLSSEERRNISVTFNEYNIQKLQSEFPYLNWHDYISWNLNDAVTVDENDVIIVPDVNYLRQLNALLQKIPNRTVANYLAWRSVLFSGDLLDDSLHQRFDQYNADITGVRKSIPRLTECVKQTMNLYVNQKLPFSVSVIKKNPSIFQLINLGCSNLRAKIL